jgi:hypothetical protein
MPIPLREQLRISRAHLLAHMKENSVSAFRSDVIETIRPKSELRDLFEAIVVIDRSA